MISIVIPCYNAATTIERALASCLIQPYVREVILVDDGSTDQTFEMLQVYAQKHEQVHAYKMPKNEGAAMARNWGVLHSSAPFLAFLDADDEYLPNAFDFAVKALNSLAYLAAVKLPCQFLGWPVDVVDHPSYENTCILLSNTFAGNLLIRREAFMALGMFPDTPDFRAKGGEDGAFMFSMMRHFTIGQVAGELPSVSIYYHENSHAYQFFKIQQGVEVAREGDLSLDSVKASYVYLEQSKASFVSLGRLLDQKYEKGFQSVWNKEKETQ